MIKRLLLLSLLFCYGFVVNENCPHPDKKNGQIGMWHCDEASWNTTANEVLDASGTGNHGTAVGGATTSATAVFRMSGIGDGAGDYVTIADAASLSALSAITVCIWQRTSSTEAKFNGWISKNQEPEKEWAFDYRPSDGYVAFFVHHRGNQTIGYYWGPDITLNDDIWFFMVATFNGTFTDAGTKVYKNGSLMSVAFSGGGGSGGSAMQNTTAPVRFLMGVGDGEGFEFPGKMDDIAIYNRALTIGEIQLLYYQQIGRHR